MISEKDLARIRNLAKHQLELAHSERNQSLYRDWQAHGRMDGSGRPMVTIELWTFGDELVQPRLVCETPEGRQIEAMLVGNLLNFEQFHDDSILRDYIPVSASYHMVPFGLPSLREESGGLGHRIIPQVHDLAMDFGKLGPSTVNKDITPVYARIDYLNSLIGDILPARLTGGMLGISPMGNVVRIMTMENMFIAMCDEPELFHQMMDMQTRDYINMIDQMEMDGILLPTTGDQWLCQGSYCFTSDLPSTGERLKTTQVWGYMDSQETSGVSPEMFHEFVFPYYKRIADRFGLLSYGCCEAVHSIWEDSVSHFQSLRKVSISPWCDEAYMGEALQGRKVVFHRKPSPNFIGVDRYIDEATLKPYLARTAVAARGLTLEFSQRDVYTVHGDIDKVARYVALIREACDLHWRP